jgi:hypothetical protein
MSRTIDELSHRSCYRRRTCHATPARRDHTGRGALCATLVPSGLGACANLAWGRHSCPRAAHGDRGLTDDGARDGAAFHELPSGLEPGHVVGTPGQLHAVGAPHHRPPASRSSQDPGSRRHRGTAQRAEDHRERVLPGCGAFDPQACYALLWLEVGVDDARGPRALEWASVGVPVSDRPVLAGEEAGSAAAQDSYRWGLADAAASTALAAGAPAGAGRRWRLRRGLAGPGLCQTPGGHGLAPAPRPPGKRGPKPTKGPRQRRLQGWAERRDTPWETVEVAWYGGQRKTLWVFSRTALWYTPRLPPVAIRFVIVCAPAGKLRMEAFFCTDLQATPGQILEGVIMRWSVEVTFEEARAHLGLETQRQWSALAIARTTPVLLALFSRVTLLALRLSQGGQIPVEATAWYHKTEPTFVDCLALVRRHLWRARYLVNSAAEPEFVQLPREAFELWLTGVPLAA